MDAQLRLWRSGSLLLLPVRRLSRQGQLANRGGGRLAQPVEQSQPILAETNDGGFFEGIQRIGEHSMQTPGAFVGVEGKVEASAVLVQGDFFQRQPVTQADLTGVGDSA